jgi:ParB-like chromosome segregation protein Spo0J
MIQAASEEILFGHKVHPLAARFPLLEGPEFDELVSSVKTDGLRKPIKKDAEGNIVDGRNRLRACMKAGVEPAFSQLNEHDDILTIILQENVLRRHLTASQRAMIAADLSEATVGRPAKDSTSVSSATAAKKLQVSRSSVADAKKILKDGDEALVKAVEQGQIDVKPAAQIAKLPVEEQRQAVAQVAESGKKSRNKPTAAQFSRDKWRAKAEVAHSKLLAEAPPDLQDWARGTFRDVTGGSLRREAKIDIPDGDEVALYDADDVIQRIEAMLKEIPVGERKGIKQAIGEHFIGDKPEQYMADLPEDNSEALKLVSSELKYRSTLLDESPDAQKILKKASGDIRKLAKSDEE